MKICKFLNAVLLILQLQQKVTSVVIVTGICLNLLSKYGLSSHISHINLNLMDNFVSSRCSSKNSKIIDSILLIIFKTYILINNFKTFKISLIYNYETEKYFKNISCFVYCCVQTIFIYYRTSTTRKTSKNISDTL